MEEITPNIPSTEPPNSTLAIISLVSGILGWTVLPLLGAVVAVITGHMAKREIRDSAGTLGGDGMATAGLVLGYSSLALGLLVICAVIGIIVVAIIASQQDYGLLLLWLS